MAEADILLAFDRPALKSRIVQHQGPSPSTKPFTSLAIPIEVQFSGILQTTVRVEVAPTGCPKASCAGK